MLLPCFVPLSGAYTVLIYSRGVLLPFTGGMLCIVTSPRASMPAKYAPHV